MSTRGSVSPCQFTLTVWASTDYLGTWGVSVSEPAQRIQCLSNRLHCTALFLCIHNRATLLEGWEG